MVVDRVLDVVPSGLDEHGRGVGRIAGQEVILAADLAGGADEDVPLGLRELDAHLVALVLFLGDENVIARLGAQPVPPDLERPHRLVRPDVEERPAVRGPRGAVVDAVDHIVAVVTRTQVAKAQRVQLGAVDVHGVRDEALVGAALHVAELEVLVARRQLVAVEHDLLGRVHRTSTPAVDLVVEALHRAGVAPPPLVERRGRCVGLLHPADDLVVEPVLQVGALGHDAVGICVLGLQVGDHVWVRLVAKPVVGVDAAIAVGLEDLGPLGGDGRTGGGDFHPLHDRDRARPGGSA